MRIGAPSASTNRSSGLAGKPSGAPFSGVFGCDRLGPVGRPRVGDDVRAGTAPCGESRPGGRWCPAGSSGWPARASSGSRWSAPPGRASRGRPPGAPRGRVLLAPGSRSTGSAARRPGRSAVTPISCARRADALGAGMPVMPAAHSACTALHALAQQLERRRHAACRRAWCSGPRAPGRSPRRWSATGACRSGRSHQLCCAGRSAVDGVALRALRRIEREQSSLALVRHHQLRRRW